jgi:hypothetical protein
MLRLYPVSIFVKYVTTPLHLPMQVKELGMLGLGSMLLGLGLLVITFIFGYMTFQSYSGLTASGDLASTMGTLLFAAIQALYLGLMGWVASLLMIRGIDIAKVERGVGVVTFKVDKGVGIMTQQASDDKKPT